MTRIATQHPAPLFESTYALLDTERQAAADHFATLVTVLDSHGFADISALNLGKPCQCNTGSVVVTVLG